MARLISHDGNIKLAQLDFLLESWMREVGAFEAKNTLGTLLDLVERGEEVVITRHGKPVARMVKESTRGDRSVAIEAAREIRALAKNIKAGNFDWAEWKDYRDEGRR